MLTIMRAALLKKNEVSKKGMLRVDAVIVDGVHRSYGFAKDRLLPYRNDVIEIIKAVAPEQFFKGDNGNQNGGLILLLKKDREGNKWGEDLDVEHLICLSIGLGLGEFCHPREEWHALPNKIPFFVFDIDRGQNAFPVPN